MPANSMVGMNDTGSVNGLNPRQMLVFNLIRASTLEQGISKQDMYATLGDKMSQVEFELVFHSLMKSFMLFCVSNLAGKLFWLLLLIIFYLQNF